ncbi:DUF4229 domain-containing protein [Stackebrandtia soli]|uniref:DUF4229 domain-containing protein n=1 Tax=Stackebrandtia soli TaxID=1892856 RepID=UPI0039ED139B
MSPTVTYLLARLALFVVIAVALWPTGLHPLVLAMAALLGAYLLSLVLLRRLRAAMLADVDSRMNRRRAHKERLRAALAGEDD